MKEVIEVNVKREYAKNIIESLKGRFFTATFIGKHDRVLHKVNGRTGVIKHLQSNRERTTTPDLLSAFNVHKMDYRTVNLDGIVEIRCDGKVYKFE